MENLKFGDGESQRSKRPNNFNAGIRSFGNISGGDNKNGNTDHCPILFSDQVIYSNNLNPLNQVV